MYILKTKKITITSTFHSKHFLIYLRQMQHSGSTKIHVAGKLEEKGISMVIQKTCSLLYILGPQPWQYPIPRFLISLIDSMEVQ